MSPREEMLRSLSRLDIEDETKSECSDETVRPARALRRVKSSENLRELAAAARRVVSGDTTNQPQPRADRGGLTTAENAQGRCPAEACLFAANLLDSKTMAQHEESLHEVFDVFGTNWIQVREDRNRHPFAIIQFETVQESHDALRNGQGLILDGRSIRLEKAKVERALLITDMRGERLITENEARTLLTRFGQIELICSTDMIPGRPSYLPRGQYVRFMYWLDCRDALQFFHQFNDDSYRLQLANGLEPRLRKFNTGATIVSGMDRESYPADHASIFVGNLPEDVTKPEIVEIFAAFGDLIMVNLVKKYFPTFTNCFAFVEYSSQKDADAAFGSEVTLRGHKLRIEPKEYTSRRKTRLAWGAAPMGMTQEGVAQGTQVPQTMTRPQPEAETFPSAQAPAGFGIAPAARTALMARLSENEAANKVVKKEEVDDAPEDKLPAPQGDRSNIYCPPHRRMGGANPYTGN